MRGSTGKPPGQAVTRHKRLDFIEVPDRPCRPRPLPPRRGRKPWPAGIEELWRGWSSMPHVRLWKRTDWDFAVDSLHVAAMAFEHADVKWWSELRVRERWMGCTLDARQGMHIRYTPVEAADKPTVSRLDDYRAL